MRALTKIEQMAGKLFMKGTSLHNKELIEMSIELLELLDELEAEDVEARNGD